MSDDERYVVRCRGLPWSATSEEVSNFFSGCELAEGLDSIHMTTTREGRPSGEAYIEFASESDLESAIKKDRQLMGKRYVEVFKSKYSEMEWVLERSGGGGGSGNQDSWGEEGDGGSGGDNVVRLRGLPFEATREDIVKFFKGLEITNNGILQTTNYQGRATGEAFVQFANKESVEKALAKNKETIGRRYIEIFHSSMSEAFRNQQQGGPPMGSDGGFRGGMSRGGYGMMGRGRPSPYDRMGPGGGVPMGRGYGPGGPSRGSRSFKSFSGGGGSSSSSNDYNDYGNGGFNGAGYGGGMGLGMRGGGGVGGGPMSGGVGGGGGGMGPPSMGGGMALQNRHVVRMRGLPFRVTENDIAEWFSSVADPIGINIRYNNQGRPAGEAEVAFASAHDAKRALSKDRQNMQHRYVELFYDGPVDEDDDDGLPPDSDGGGIGSYGSGFQVGMRMNRGGGMNVGNPGMNYGGGSMTVQFSLGPGGSGGGSGYHTQMPGGGSGGGGGGGSGGGGGGSSSSGYNYK